MSNRANGRTEDFMKRARTAKRQSKDPNCKVGACIVSQDDEIISLGVSRRDAIVNSGRNDFKGCRMYVTRMPCDDCAKLIIQHKIKEVIYEEMKGKSIPASTENMFKALESEGFVLRKFENSNQSENRNNSPSKKKIERQNSDSDDCFLSDPKKRKM